MVILKVLNKMFLNHALVLLNTFSIDYHTQALESGSSAPESALQESLIVQITSRFEFPSCIVPP